VRTAVVATATAATLLFAWKAPTLPLDDFATRLRPGVEVGNLCAGAGDDAVCLDTVVSDLAKGEHLVVMAALDDPGMEQIVENLNARAADTTGQPVWLLSSSSPEQHKAFFWQWGPSFEVVEAPEAVLRPLYRKLPRSFVVRDGRVVETFAGLPPVPPTAAPASAAAASN
jgi:hypothetical protein